MLKGLCVFFFGVWALLTKWLIPFLECQCVHPSLLFVGFLFRTKQKAITLGLISKRAIWKVKNKTKFGKNSTKYQPLGLNGWHATLYTEKKVCLCDLLRHCIHCLITTCQLLTLQILHPVPSCLPEWANQKVGSRTQRFQYFKDRAPPPTWRSWVIWTGCQILLWSQLRDHIGKCCSVMLSVRLPRYDWGVFKKQSQFSCRRISRHYRMQEPRNVYWGVATMRKSTPTCWWAKHNQ